MEKVAKIQRRKVGVAGLFQNQMMGNNKTEPVVGEGATELMYSDRHAYDVTWVSEDGMECKIRPCKCKYVGKGYGDEQYEYSPDPDRGETLLRYNPKAQKWQKIFKVIRPIKAQMKRWQKEFGDWNWRDGLMRDFGKTQEDISFQEGEEGYSHGIWNYKLVEGITKEYEEKHDISIIFGTRQEYRDPHF